MKRLVNLSILALCINAAIFFVLIQLLPKTGDFLVNEVGEMATQNMKAYDNIQSLTLRGLDRLRNFTKPPAVECSGYFSWVLSASDTVYHRFESVRDDTASIRRLTDSLYKLPPLLQHGLNNPWHQRFMKRGIDRFVRLSLSSNAQVRKLRLETLEGWIFNSLQEYADSVNSHIKGDAKNIEYSKLPGFSVGYLAFNPPSTMAVDLPGRLQVRISKKFTEDLIKGLNSNNPTTDSLLTSDVMVVRLTGENFDITSYDDEEQGVLDNGFTQWEFGINPTHSGKQTLFLKVGIVYNVTGIGATKKFLPVYERDIEVQVSVWRVVSSFAADRWEFLISTFLIPALVWGYQRMRNRGEKDTNK